MLAPRSRPQSKSHGGAAVLTALVLAAAGPAEFAPAKTYDPPV